MMKHISRRWFLGWILLGIAFYAEVQVSALEISSETGLMLFDSGVQNFPADTEGSEMEYNFIQNLSFDHHFTDMFGLEIILDHDPILSNRAFARFGVHTPFFSFRGGPFVGLFNGPLILNPGLSVAATGNLAKFFGYFQFDTTLGGGLNQPKNYTPDHLEFHAGFQFPFNLFAAFGMDIKTYSKTQENNSIITTERIKYYLSGEYTEKLWYFSNIKIFFGYQELKWFGSLGSWKMEYLHQSLYAGLDLAFQIKPFLKLNVAAEMPIYYWVAQNVQEKPIQSTMLCEFTLGLTWKFRAVTDKR